MRNKITRDEILAIVLLIGQHKPESAVDFIMKLLEDKELGEANDMEEE